MKEQNLEEGLDSSVEVFDVPADMVEEPIEAKDAPSASKSHLTELRRRIEERLDSKRIAHEFDYDDLDDIADDY